MMWKSCVGALGVMMIAVPGVWAETWPACGDVATYPRAEWRLADPSRQGWDEQRLEEARALFEAQESAALMVVHRGRLIAQWGSVEERYTAQSVRKALLNSLVGQLVGEGRLQLSQTLADLGIGDSDPSLSENERQATVRDLLMSRSGIFHSALYEVGGWTRIRQQLAQREREAGRDLFGPGDYWVYNNWDFNALGTIVEQSTRTEIGALFEERVARPLSMQDFRPEDVEYTTRDHPAEQRFNNVSDHRAYVFNISTRDLARYGLLYLGCGRWRGEQVVPREWVLESIDGRDTRDGRPEGETETGFADYGYLWQIDRPGFQRFGNVPLEAPMYIATGNRGHVLFVIPYLDLVVAHQVATVGGVSAEAQQRRFLEGSPQVSDYEIAALLSAIIAAHPDRE